MDFAQVVDFCQKMAEALVTLIQPVMRFFSLTIGEYFTFLEAIVPLVLKPIVNGAGDLFRLLGIDDTTILIFLFGSGIVFYLACIVIKWVLDIVL